MSSIRPHLFWRRALATGLAAASVVLTLLVVLKVHHTGTPGFRYDPAQTAFVVSQVDISINALQPDDRIIAIADLEYGNVLGYWFHPRPTKSALNRLRVAQGDETVDLEVLFTPLTLMDLLRHAWIHLALILLFICCSLTAVYFAGPEQPAALFALMFLSFAVIIASEMVFNFGQIDPRWISAAWLLIVIGNWLAFSSWFHFFMRFPVERQILNNRAAIAAIYLLPPLLSIAITFYMTGPTHQFWGLLQSVRRIGVPLFILGSWVKHFWDLVKVSSPVAKNQLKLTSVSLVVGLGPYLFLFMLPIVFRGDPLITFRVVVFSAMVIPLAFLVAMLRYRLMDVDQTISTSLTYFAVVAVIYGLYTLLVVGISRLAWTKSYDSKDILLPFLIFVALVFNPLKNRIQRGIDHLFFRDQVDLDGILHRLSRQIADTRTVPGLADLLNRRFPDEFYLSRGTLVLFDHHLKERFTDPGSRFGRLLWHQRELIGALERGRDYYLCYESSPDSRFQAERDELVDAGYDLVIGLKTGEQLVGLLCLGPKQNGRLFTRRELNVWVTLAGQAATALENALRYEALEKSRDEMQRLHAKKVRAEKLAAVGEMTALMAHEVRNPLAVIRSSAQMLTGGTQTEFVNRELLEFITTEVDNLDHVILGLLGQSQYQAPTMQPFDIVNGLAELVRSWQTGMDHNPKIEIAQNFAAGPLSIFGDRRQLSQVFLNLIRNAEEAMPQGGRIDISLRENTSREGVEITVKDSGEGIRPGDRKQIFNKFFTTKDEGLGLGLPLCRRIVQAHNGTIELSNLPHGGVCARVTLPQKPLQPPVREPAKSP